MEIIGIDFGTTNSLVGIVENNSIVILKDKQTNTELIKSQKDIKRQLGFSDNSIKVASDTINYLKLIAEEYLNKTISHCVITVPAYFNDIQRSAIKNACNIAKLNVVRILNEPTAAALAYDIPYDCIKNVLVYDFGGGTHDVSIVNIMNGIYNVISSYGNLSLGGDDIDERISNKLNITIQEAQQLKHNNSIDIYELCKDIIDDTMVSVKKSLEHAFMTPDDIDEVLLVGGSSRLICVKELLENYFGDNKINIKLDPDKSIVYGATVMANVLMNNTTKVLIDIVSLSLGVEIDDGIMSIIIPSGTKLPIKVTRLYTTNYDNQEMCNINIYEGNSKYIKNNYLIGTMKLIKIPQSTKNKVIIKITFEITIDGTCEVTAECNEEICKEIIWQKTNQVNFSDC
jgi:molecular chaperone DnaK (HSP70)